MRGVRACLVLITTLLLVACGGADPAATPAPRAITTEESQRLATSRFLNYDAGSRAFHTTVAVGQQRVDLVGWIDFTTHTGYALAQGRDFVPQLVRWNLGTVALQPAPTATSGKPPLPMATTGWRTRQLDPSRSTLDTVLLVIANLGLDRPENPLLLQQSGALWLGQQDLDDRALTVFAAPPTDKPAASASVGPDDSGLRIWIDDAGMMYRAQVRTGAEWSDVDFEDGEAPRLPKLPNTPSGTQ